MMPEPVLLGYPLSTLALYFLFYSCLGWTIETVYCSILEKRFVARGFLRGPLCPIYGVGVLLMILFFEPLKGNLVVFYLGSALTMSAWEYFVGWFLEVTTHMKYWDYSMYRINLHGRICLWVCLVWGLLSYVVIFWLHPAVAGHLFVLLPTLARQILAIVLLALTAVDAVFTIRELALMTKMMNKLQTISGQFQDQVAQGKVKLKEMYDDTLTSAERYTRRFRNIYKHIRAPKMDHSLREAIRNKALQVAQERQLRKLRKKHIK